MTKSTEAWVAASRDMSELRCRSRPVHIRSGNTWQIAESIPIYLFPLTTYLNCTTINLLYNAQTITMAPEQNFTGWVGLDKESAKGNMKWQEFEPKTFTDDDVDVRPSHAAQWQTATDM